MTARGARWTGLILAIVLGQFLYLRARSAWTNSWLLNDAQKGTAIITRELWSGHNAVGYRYVVDQSQYSGRSGRTWQDPKYSKVKVGEESVVFFSASHPWLSRLYMPQSVLEGVPVILIGFVLEAFAVITIIKPQSRWAFSLIERKQSEGAPNPKDARN
jgi:hypothetical protein